MSLQLFNEDLRPLVETLRKAKSEGRFAGFSEEDVFETFIAALLGREDVGWAERVGAWNAVSRYIPLTPKVRLYVFHGGTAVDENRRRNAVNDSRVILDLAIVTNFDYWEVIHKGESLVQYSAAQFVEGEPPKWEEFLGVFSREAIEAGDHLRRIDELTRSSEDSIEPLLRAFERLRTDIGNYLIQDAVAIKKLRIESEHDDEYLNAVVQRVIDRFIIYRFAEDNGIIVKGSPRPISDLYYQQLRSKVGPQEEALRKQQHAWQAIRDEHFPKFADAYNGGIFLPLPGDRNDVIGALPLTDWHIKQIIERIADIPFQQGMARIIGYIYEKYIGKKLYITRWEPKKPEQNKVELRNTPEKRDKGIYYTPQDVTQYIASNTVGVVFARLHEKLDAAGQTSDRGQQADKLIALMEEAKTLAVCDPACGSGSFLIEALGVVKDFYQRLSVACGDCKLPKTAPQHTALEAAQAALQTPGVLALNHNIYGVDLDPKAVEICAVSLMIQVIDELRLSSTGRSVRFPSIMGENIKCGNSVISGVPFEERETLLQELMEDIQPIIELRQTIREVEGDEKKGKLVKSLSAAISKLYEQVQGTSRPPGVFTYELEFPEVFWGPNGGFATVLGNPPYADLPADYGSNPASRRYHTVCCRDLYTLFIEDLLHYTSPALGRSGMIVPHSLTFSRDMRALRRVLIDWQCEARLATFDNIPDCIFKSGKPESTNTNRANSQRTTILLIDGFGSHLKLQATDFLRWSAEERGELFGRISYADVTEFATERGIPKIGRDAFVAFLRALRENSIPLDELRSRTGTHALYLGATPRYFIGASTTELERDGQITLLFDSSDSLAVASVILNSETFYWYWRAMGDGFHLTQELINGFPVPRVLLERMPEVRRLARALRKAEDFCGTTKLNNGKLVHNINFDLDKALVEKVTLLVTSAVPNSPLAATDFHQYKSSSSFSAAFRDAVEADDEASD